MVMFAPVYQELSEDIQIRSVSAGYDSRPYSRVQPPELCIPVLKGISSVSSWRHQQPPYDTSEECWRGKVAHNATRRAPCPLYLNF